MEKYLWIVTDYYWLWLSVLFLCLGWDSYLKGSWPSVWATVLKKKKYDQKYQVGDDDDYRIPMDKKPVSFFSGNPKETYIKSSITVEYEFLIKKKKYQTKKVFENVKSENFFEQLFAEKEVQLPGIGGKLKIYYNPKNPKDNILERTSFFGMSSLFFLGFLFLVLAYFFQLS